MSQFIADFREQNPQYNDMQDSDLVTALHGKFYSDIPIEQFNQKIGFQVTPIEPDINQQSDNFIQASPRQEAQQPLQTGYGASSDIPIQEQPQIDGYTGADTKQPFKPMGELVTEKLSAIGEGVLRAGQNVLPQFKSQLGGLMQTQETPLLTPSEFYMNEQRGTINDIPMQFESYEDYTKAHEQTKGIGSYIAKKGKELRESAKGEMKPSTAERGSTEYYIEQGVGSILNMVPMLAVSIAGKRPDIGLGIMLAQVDGDAYGQGRDQGLSQQDAKAYAAFQSVAEVIPSALPLGKMLSGSGVITQGLSEGAQEVVTAALQAGIDKGYINPEMTWGEAAERMKDAAIIGAGSGATMALATKPFAPKEESYADDPLKAVAVQMESELANKDMKDFVTKAFDKQTADVIVQDQAEKQGVIDELPAKEQSKPEQIKPEEVAVTSKPYVIKRKSTVSDREYDVEVVDHSLEYKGLEKLRIEKPLNNKRWYVVNTATEEKFNKGFATKEEAISFVDDKDNLNQLDAKINSKAHKERRKNMEDKNAEALKIGLKGVKRSGRYFALGNKLAKGEITSEQFDKEFKALSDETNLSNKQYEQVQKAYKQLSTLPAKEQPKPEQIKPEEVKAEIAKEPIDKEAIPDQEPTSFDGPKQEIPEKEIIAEAKNKKEVPKMGSEEKAELPQKEYFRGQPKDKDLKINDEGLLWITPDREYASDTNYGGKPGSEVVSIDFDGGNLFDFNNEEHKRMLVGKGKSPVFRAATRGGFRELKDPEVKQAIKEMGFDGFKAIEPEGQESVALFDASKAKKKAGPTKRKVFDWDAAKLSKNYTAKELDQWIKELAADPDNKNLSGGIGLYNKSTMKKIDKLTWAVTYIQQAGKESATVPGVDEQKPSVKPEAKKTTEVIAESNKKTGKGLTDADKIEPAKSTYSAEPIQAYSDFRESVGSQTATAEEIKADAESLIKNKDKVIASLGGLTNKDLNKLLKNPKPRMKKSDLVQKAWEEMLYSHVMKKGSITTFTENESFDKQALSEINKQTKIDINKEADNSVQEASMSRDGKMTYPKPQEDINTKEYKKLDSQMSQKPKDGEKIFHAPGHNYVGLFRSTGIPPRREFVFIEGRKLNIPDKPQRIEPIIGKLVKIMGRRIYFGKIKGKSSEGFYRPNVGEIRTRKKNDVEVLAHEMAHYLDFYSNVTLPNFQKLYKEPQFKDEISALSYTDADAKIELIEGFAEFTRLWLTNSQEALIRAPKFYEAFTNMLGRDRKLLNPMRDMQDLMHKFYFQGADKLGQALIGSSPSYKQRFNEWAYRRDSRIRQQMIDRFHAARKVEQELTKKIGNVQESAWKQFRLAHGGSEGISDYIMNYGTVNFDEAGDLKRSGKSLHEVLEPVKSIKLTEAHKGEQKIDVLLRYFAGRRALELHRQGRENLIPKETAKEWARLGKEYPVFESIQQEYQAFNDRMMDFYEEAGMITPKGRKAMKSMNKDYVPFNRIRDQLAGGKTGAGGGIQKLKGGTANLNDILVNMQDGITANVRSALTNRAKQRLYQYISSHKDGAIFATKLAPDSKPVQVYADEMQSKIGQVLEANGIEVEGDLDLTNSDLLTFWQHGVKPKLNESGNIVDQVVIDGKPKYYEVQDPMLQEMLLSMNPESYGSFMNIMFGVKNFFTRSITLGVEFTGANLVRDTIGATFLSKNNFKPFISSFDGMYSFFKKDKYYQDFVRSGGGYSGRLEASTREGTARRRVSIDEFGVLSMPERLLSSIDNLASAFEYGTRIGEFKLSKKNMKSDMDAGFDAREISTDFSAIGANRFLTGYIRTVPFLNAMIQSQDRVFREAIVTKQYDGNPTAMAMKSFLGITVPTLLLYLVNKDDEDYQAIPDYEKRTNWHIPIGGGQFVKIPRPYDVGFVYATMPEIFAKYVEDDKGKEFAEGMIWTMTQMYGIDGVPAMMTGWWDLVRNKKWTGAPVVPQSLANVEATEQYTSNTAETFVRMGEALGVSPIKAEHMFKAYTGYLGGYVLWGTDHMLWDESKFGEKPESKTSDNIFLRRFLTPDVRPSSSSMEKFFDLKEKSDRAVATFKQTVDVRRKIKGQMKDAGKFKDDRFFGLSGKEKEVIFGLNDSMNKLIKLIYGKEGIKTAELKIKYDKNLSGKEKREQMDKIWLDRNKAFEKYYNLANQALQKAKREAKQEK